MANYDKDLEVWRKNKLFFIDFVPVIAHAHGNVLYMLNGKQMQIISVVLTFRS